MNMTLKLTLDGLIEALRWRQIEGYENPARVVRMGDVDGPSVPKRTQELNDEARDGR
jgi:hypothetical protein